MQRNESQHNWLRGKQWCVISKLRESERESSAASWAGVRVKLWELRLPLALCLPAELLAMIPTLLSESQRNILPLSLLLSLLSLPLQKEMRHHVVRFLLETEQSYVQSLRTIIKVSFTPLLPAGGFF